MSEIISEHPNIKKQYEIDTKEVAESVIYNLRERNGYYDRAFQQQSEATIQSGSRYEALQFLEVPSLIIHGTTDPLIDFAHGKKCAELIPNAKSLWVEGMGHDIPEVFLGDILKAIFGHFESIQTQVKKNPD